MVNKITRRRRRNTKKRSKKRLRGGSIPEKCIFVKFVRKDGLGNRLFIYSVARIVSKDTGHSICIVESENSNPHSKTDYNNLYSNVQFVKEGDVKTRVDKAFELYHMTVFGHLSKDDYMVDTNRDFLIQSSCQNYPFVKEVLPDIRKMLTDNEFHKDSYKDLKTKINSKDSAFMHVRRGDYVWIGWDISYEYYCNALKELEKNSEIKNIYVVSDDLVWCRERKERWSSCAPNKIIEILEGLNELQTLYAMMLCKAGAVISNSTFSAWGAMLGADENTKSTIVYPKSWIVKYKEHEGENPLRFSDKWTAIENHTQGGGSFIPNHRFSFISYGNDIFKQSKERVKKEAERMGCFNGEIKIYGPEDLSEEFKKATGEYLKEPRGAGYWLWKPYIIADMLSKMNNNDLLLYADAGCTLQPVGLPRLHEYVNMISPESGYSVLAMRLLDGTSWGGKGAFLSKKWTSTSIFNHYSVPIDGDIANLNQILATVIVFRKCPETITLVNEWLNVAKTNTILFSDVITNTKITNPDFKENRHDQAVFSILVQIEPYKKFCKIIDDEVDILNNGPTTEKMLKFSPVIAGRKKI